LRRIDNIITYVRQATENLSFSDDTGISDEELLSYANESQEKVQSLILNTYPDIFLREKEITSVASQESYTIPSDVFLGTRIQKVDYSRTGVSRDYYRLEQRQLVERYYGLSSDPSYYIRQSDQVLIQPAPQSSGAKIKLLYQFSVPTLDKRRATVSSATLNLANNTITTLILDTTVDLDSVNLLSDNLISIVDMYGVVKMRGIKITAIDTGSGVVTVDSSFVFETGETIAAGHFALMGVNATTHSQLTHTCERFITAYMKWKVYARDSSSDLSAIERELASISSDIIASYADSDNSVDRVPILNADYFPGEDW
jgi:hypothetical protein